LKRRWNRSNKKGSEKRTKKKAKTKSESPSKLLENVFALRAQIFASSMVFCSFSNQISIIIDYSQLLMMNLNERRKQSGKFVKECQWRHFWELFVSFWGVLMFWGSFGVLGNFESYEFCFWRIEIFQEVAGF
jgi:hypothetical protein